MANKWAIQNGNWSDTSTWNDGVVPGADDDVWLNGCVVNIGNMSVVAKTVSNGSDGNLSVGGYLSSTYNSVINIDADLFAIASYILFSAGQQVACTGYINGDITTVNGMWAIEASENAYTSLVINGNFNGGSFAHIYGGGNNQVYITINGNIYANGDVFSFISGSIRTLNFSQNGNLTLDNAKFVNGLAGATWNFNGEVKLIDASLECVTKNATSYEWCINGSLNISQTNKTIFSSTLCKISTTSGLTIVDVAREVPPQSVVLEGYQYGDKVGTLKTVPDNVAIVNLTAQQLQRVGNCATVSTVQKCFEEFKE